MLSPTVKSPESGPKRRIFIVDDHPLVRESLTSLIDRQADLIVCGHAATSAAAFEAIGLLQPDAAIVDLSLEGGSGLELIKQLQVLTVCPRILVLSMHDEMLYAERALRAGALGYVMKRVATGKVIEALRHVLLGNLYLNDAVAVQMAQKLVSTRVAPGESPMNVLSDREIEVFRLLGRGYPTKKIAEELNLSPKTVQVYCGRIKEKLALPDVRTLIREAVRWMERESQVQ